MLPSRLTEDRVPQEDGAGLETTGDLVYPLVVKSHPARGLLAVTGDVAGLGGLVEVWSGEVLGKLDWVESPLALGSEAEDAHRGAQDRAGGRRLDVKVVSEPKDNRSRAEDDGREEEREPEPDVLLGVNHADLSNQRTNVNKEVEVLVYQLVLPLRTHHVDPRSCESGVDNNSLSSLGGADKHFGLAVLLSNQGRDVTLEGTGSRTHD